MSRNTSADVSPRQADDVAQRTLTGMRRLGWSEGDLALASGRSTETVREYLGGHTTPRYSGRRVQPGDGRMSWAVLADFALALGAGVTLYGDIVGDIPQGSWAGAVSRQQATTTLPEPEESEAEPIVDDETRAFIVRKGLALATEAELWTELARREDEQS